MANLKPVEHDPFAGGEELAPVDRDPFAPAYSGKILPLSKSQDGTVSFDSNAGVLGLAKSILSSGKDAATLPHDVYTGSVDPLSDEGISRALNLGLWATPVNPAVRAGDRAIPGMAQAVRPDRSVPTTEKLLEVGGKQIDSAKKAGVEYSAQTVTDFANGLRATLERDIHPSTAPGSYTILKDLQVAPADGTVRAPLEGLIAARDNFKAIAQNFNPAAARDQLAATRIIKAIDDFIEKPPTEGVLAGPAAAASRIYTEGRGNYAAGKRSAAIGGREAKAELQAAIANSGKGSGNRLRAAAAWFVDPLYPKRSSGFSPEEIRLLEGVANGTVTRNRFRDLGNLLGGGGGLGGMLTGVLGGGTVGAASGRPGLGIVAGVAGPAIGTGARTIDNRLTSRAFRKADEAVRSRSPLNERIQANPPMTPISPKGREAMVKSLLAPKVMRPDPSRTMTQEEWDAYVRGGGA